MSLTKAKVQAVRADVTKALDDVMKKHGLVGGWGRITYTPGEMRGKLTFNIKPSAADVAPSPRPTPSGTNTGVYTAAQLAGVARSNVLPVDLQGRQFSVGGSMFTLTGVKSSRPKYPFQGTGARGGKYKFTVAQVAAGLI